MISVIIPTYNEASVILDCVDSLSKQTSTDFEVVIVDDGSTDDTPQKLAGYNVIHSKHLGAGAARNLGAKNSKGEILVFVDADMIFDKDFLKNLVKPIEDGKVIGTFSKEEFLENKNNIWAVCWNINRGLPKDRMHGKNYPDKQKVYRAILKKEFEKVGGFDEKAGYTDDWSLSEKLGVEAVNAPGTIFYHKNPDNLKDVFIQAKWMAKRKYKFGFLGGLYRAWFPIRLSPVFIIFKIVFGVGFTIGILEYFVGKVSK